MADVEIVNLPSVGAPDDGHVFESQTEPGGPGTSHKTTRAEIVADVQAEVDVNTAKLATIEPGATADQTDAEIKTAYEDNANTNAFTDAEQAKLAGVDAGAQNNTSSNAGAGNGLALAKVGSDLPFKGLAAGANVTIDSTADTLTINSTASGGGGDVVGPASAVDNRLATFDGATGKLIQDSGSLVTDFATSTQGAKADSALQAVEDDTAPVMGGDLLLNGNSLYDIYTAAPTNSFVPGQIGHLDINGQVKLASANTEAAGGNKDLLMALDAISPSQAGRFAEYGQVKGLAGGVAEAPVYLGVALGDTQLLPPTGADQVSRLVGYWLDVNTFKFKPSPEWVVVL